MIVGVIIWGAASIFLLIIGIQTWNSKEATGFYTGIKAPKVNDVRKYNHAVAALWFVYAACLELLGIPLLSLEQNSAGFVIPVFGVVGITIALMIVYQKVLVRYTKEE